MYASNSVSGGPKRNDPHFPISRVHVEVVSQFGLEYYCLKITKDFPIGPFIRVRLALGITQSHWAQSLALVRYTERSNTGTLSFVSTTTMVTCTSRAFSNPPSRRWALAGGWHAAPDPTLSPTPALGIPCRRPANPCPGGAGWGSGCSLATRCFPHRHLRH